MKRALALLASAALLVPGPATAQSLSEAIVEPMAPASPMETQAAAAPAPAEALQLSPASVLDPMAALPSPDAAPISAPLRTVERPADGLRALPRKLVEKEPSAVLEGTFDLRRQIPSDVLSPDAAGQALAKPRFGARASAAATGLAVSLYSTIAAAAPDGYDHPMFRGRDGAMHPADTAAGAFAAIVSGIFFLGMLGVIAWSNYRDRKNTAKADKQRETLLAWSEASKPFFTEAGAPAAAEEADADPRPWYKRFRVPWKKAAEPDDSPVVLAAATPAKKSGGKKEKPRKKIMFADVAGQDEAKLELEQVVDALKHPERYQELGGEDFEVFKGVLLYGPPGTGKTLLAQAVANEAGAAFFQANGSDFVEKLVGVGASRVRELIEKAAATGKPAIIFIDELDAMGKKRSADGGGNQEYEQTLNALLTAMDGFQKNKIIFMAATNRLDTLDPALVRGKRFALKVPVGRPDVNGRLEILKVHTAKTKLGADVDLRTLAKHTPGLAGADLADIVTDAVMLAARRNAKAVEMADFNAAVDRKTIGHSRNLLMSEEDKRVTAFHETGHAMVAHFLPHGDPIRAVTIVPKDLGALGVVQTVSEDEKLLYSKSWLLDRMAVALGGRAGEELTGDIYSGVSDDIEKATQMAQAYVRKYGMSEKVGHVSYDADGEAPRAGKPMSEKTRRLIDAEVKELVEEAYRRARQVISEHREVFDRMTAELMEKETLRPEDLERILPPKVVPARKG